MRRDAREEGLEEYEPDGPPVGMLEKLHSERAVEKAVHVLIQGLKAVTANGVPDYRSRKEAAIAILDRVEGKPIERQQIVRVTKSDTPPMEEILRSPAAAAALAKAFLASDTGRAVIKEQLNTVDV